MAWDDSMYGARQETACLLIEGADLARQLTEAISHISGTYREEEMMYKLIPTPGVMPAGIPGLWYTGEKRPVMATACMGVKLQMNTNFILSLDIGKGFDPQLSDLFIGMATTYVF